MGGAYGIQLEAIAKRPPFSWVARVVAVVDEDGAPPGELLLAWECERYPGSLPDAGGLLDQEWRVMYRMRMAQNIYNTMTRLRSAIGKQIHQLTDNDRAILKWLKDLGLLYG